MNDDDTNHTTTEASRTMRLVVGDTPQVYLAGDAILLQCTPEQAGVLAAILAHYDVLTAASPADAMREHPDQPPRVAPQGYRPTVWLHTLFALRDAASRINTRHQVGAKP